MNYHYKEINMEEFKDEFECLNSWWDIKVEDFACFINRKITVRSKRKKEQKSEMTNITNMMHNYIMKERDVDDEDEDDDYNKFV